MKTEEQIIAEARALSDMLSDSEFQELTKQMHLRQLISVLSWVIDDSGTFQPVSQSLRAMLF